MGLRFHAVPRVFGSNLHPVDGREMDRRDRVGTSSKGQAAARTQSHAG